MTENLQPIEPDFPALWAEMIDIISNPTPQTPPSFRISPHDRAWLRQIIPADLTGQFAVVTAPTVIAKHTLETKLRGPVTRILSALLGHSVELAISLDGTDEDEPTNSPGIETHGHSSNKRAGQAGAGKDSRATTSTGTTTRDSDSSAESTPRRKRGRPRLSPHHPDQRALFSPTVKQVAGSEEAPEHSGNPADADDAFTPEVPSDSHATPSANATDAPHATFDVDDSRGTSQPSSSRRATGGPSGDVLAGGTSPAQPSRSTDNRPVSRQFSQVNDDIDGPGRPLAQDSSEANGTAREKNVTNFYDVNGPADHRELAESDKTSGSNDAKRAPGSTHEPTFQPVDSQSAADISDPADTDGDAEADNDSRDGQLTSSGANMPQPSDEMHTDRDDQDERDVRAAREARGTRTDHNSPSSRDGRHPHDAIDDHTLSTDGADLHNPADRDDRSPHSEHANGHAPERGESSSRDLERSPRGGSEDRFSYGDADDRSDDRLSYDDGTEERSPRGGRPDGRFAYDADIENRPPQRGDLEGEHLDHDDPARYPAGGGYVDAGQYADSGRFGERGQQRNPSRYPDQFRADQYADLSRYTDEARAMDGRVPSGSGEYRNNGQYYRADRYADSGQYRDDLRYSDGQNYPGDSEFRDNRQYQEPGRYREFERYGDSDHHRDSDRYGDADRYRDTEPSRDAGYYRETEQYRGADGYQNADHYGDGEYAAARRAPGNYSYRETEAYGDGGHYTDQGYYNDRGQFIDAGQYSDGGRYINSDDFADGQYRQHNEVDDDYRERDEASGSYSHHDETDRPADARIDSDREFDHADGEFGEDDRPGFDETFDRPRARDLDPEGRDAGDSDLPYNPVGYDDYRQGNSYPQSGEYSESAGQDYRGDYRRPVARYDENYDEGYGDGYGDGRERAYNDGRERAYNDEREHAFHDERGSAFGDGRGSSFGTETGSGYPAGSGGGYPDEPANGYPAASGTGYGDERSSAYPAGDGSGYPDELSSGYGDERGSSYREETGSDYREGYGDSEFEDEPQLRRPRPDDPSVDRDYRPRTRDRDRTHAPYAEEDRAVADAAHRAALERGRQMRGYVPQARPGAYLTPPSDPNYYPNGRATEELAAENRASDQRDRRNWPRPGRDERRGDQVPGQPGVNASAPGQPGAHSSRPAPKDIGPLFIPGPRPTEDQPRRRPMTPDELVAHQKRVAAARLNPLYTFETFVTGNSNRYAYAAAEQVAANPGTQFNPLFIWGNSGLGKTHLMHALAERALSLRPRLRVRYISSEEFTNEWINSLRDKNADSFKLKYRDLDILIVDDIQFLAGKEGTQEEFFHTFNALYQNGKHVVLSSDRPPRELTTLEDRLRTRFEGGLISDISVPDLETRVAILSLKAAREKIRMPREVLTYIASQDVPSVRELEGLLTQVGYRASMEQIPVNMELAQAALSGLLDPKEVEMTPARITLAVATYYNLTIDDLIGPGKTRPVAHARQVAMYLCRELTELSLPRVAGHFGGRDHTTALHAERKIREEVEKNRQLKAAIEEIKVRIRNSAY